MTTHTSDNHDSKPTNTADDHKPTQTSDDNEPTATSDDSEKSDEPKETEDTWKTDFIPPSHTHPNGAPHHTSIQADSASPGPDKNLSWLAVKIAVPIISVCLLFFFGVLLVLWCRQRKNRKKYIPAPEGPDEEIKVGIDGNYIGSVPGRNENVHTEYDGSIVTTQRERSQGFEPMRGAMPPQAVIH